MRFLGYGIPGLGRVGGVSVTVKEIVQRAHIRATVRLETSRQDSPPFGDGACQKVGPKGENKVEDDESVRATYTMRDITELPAESRLCVCVIRLSGTPTP